MASTLLEQARAMHEENERLERQAVKELQQSLSSHREKLFQSHRIKNVVDAIVANSARLAEIYADADGARRDEIAALGGQDTPNPSATVFTSFYERLNEIREYHRRHAGARVVEGEADVDELIKDEPWVQFSGEEAMGKHVDMHAWHQQLCNARFGRAMDYPTFLDQLPQTHKIPRNFKFTKAYRTYVGGVAEYLESFFRRTQPLQDLAKHYSKGEEEGGEGGEGYGMKQGVVDLSAFDTVDELLDEDLVPPAKVKEALGALGLKTGGTPRERAERLLMAKTTRFEAIDPKHFAKAFAPPKKKGAKASKGSAGAAADSTNGGSGNGSGGGGSVAREVALVEAKVQRLCELLEEVRGGGGGLGGGVGCDAGWYGRCLLLITYAVLTLVLCNWPTPNTALWKPPSTPLPSPGTCVVVCGMTCMCMHAPSPPCALLAMLHMAWQPIAETRVHVEKKAGLTYEEMAAEREEVRDWEEVVEEEEESEEEEEEIYNPLKLPMGWDGKPIPYWLYKLHGLNQEFKCEICGNYSYWGRRAFERHFREFRHQHGMRCLGVPNTKAFHEVTVIKDALALWERMREKQGGSKWRPEVEEECEDREGNVYDRKTFQDLRRQGII
ncbi:unnamed protein product [Closterium sp. Naga37s-1]|nr:unnamed protein product [Closterium sp. Naga37s-1]